MRASRLLEILLILERRGRTTADRLATELDVSVRTIYRDIEALSSAGVPVYTESGPGGGVQLVEGYRSRLSGLTPDETAALGLAGLPEVADQLGLGSLLVAAQAKVDAALPPELRARASRIRERFLVDAPGWYRRAEPVPCLAVLSEAVWSEHRVDLRYQRRDQVVRRVVDPWGLVLKAGTWYLLAGAGRAGAAGHRAPRTYRVGRVIGARLREERFQRPNVDLAAAWATASASFASGLLRMEVRARVRADSLGHLRFAVTEEAAARALASASAPDADGWCDVVILAESAAVAHDELLRMGAAIEVLHPPELRAHLAATHRAAAALYGG